MLTHPLPQVVGEQQVSGEVVCEGGVKLQNFLQRVSFDDVEVAVGQRSHVSAGLRQRHLLPEHVAKHVTFTCRQTDRQTVTDSLTSTAILLDALTGFSSRRPHKPLKQVKLWLLLCCSLSADWSKQPPASETLTETITQDSPHDT